MNKDIEKTTASLRGSRLTKEEFVEKAKKIHGDLYDYSESVYVNYKTKLKIKINCPKHNKEEFLTSPISHLKNKAKSCPRCLRRSNVKLTTEEFIKISKEAHGNKYDYSLVVYTNKYGKVKIKCHNCDEIFEQIAECHYNGRGCMKCYGNPRKTKEEFIAKAKKLYPNNEYDYSRVEYSSNRAKIKIGCNKCGNVYMQVAKDHFRFGCPACANRLKISKPETEWLDQLSISNENRQFIIKTNEVKKNGVRKQRFVVDGFDPETNTVYEFLGDFWHGNLEKFSPEKMNSKAKLTFKQLNEKTFNKIDTLKKLGYNVVYIWESDYNLQKKKLKYLSK